MTTDPTGPSRPAPTSADAARILAEIAPVAQRSQRLTRDVALGVPLLGWGLAWTAGSLLFQYLPGPPGEILALAACAGAATLTRVVQSREVHLHTEGRFLLAWTVLFVTSPVLVLIAAPANLRITVVFLASLWAVGMLLYGIGTRDVPLAGLGAAIVVAATVARLLAPHAAVVVVGLVGGLGLAGLGGWRLRWRR
jgi:hypothetical protein